MRSAPPPSAGQPWSSQLCIHNPVCFFHAADLEIVGFIEIGDISSPPVLSRHLVLPIAVNKGASLTAISIHQSVFAKCTAVYLCDKPALRLVAEVDEVGAGTTEDAEEETSTNQMAGKSPNFCVLLHGSLKVEGMVALVQLG